MSTPLISFSCFMSATFSYPKSSFSYPTTSFSYPSSPHPSLPYLQDELGHLELFLQLLPGGWWGMIEQAQHVIFLHGFLVVLVVYVQDAVLAVIAGELQAFVGRAEGRQTQAREEEQPLGLHPFCFRWGCPASSPRKNKTQRSEQLTPITLFRAWLKCGGKH